MCSEERAKSDMNPVNSIEHFYTTHVLQVNDKTAQAAIFSFIR